MEVEMICWKNASRSERRQLEAIATFLSHSPHLVDFLFDPVLPKLNDSPERLLAAASGLPSGDFLLVRLALNLWCEAAGLEVHEIFNAEPEIFAKIMKAFTLLAA
jgi:hypothetical protein